MRSASALLVAGVVLSMSPGCSDGPGTRPSPGPSRTAPATPAPPPTQSPTPAPNLVSGPITFGGVTDEGTPITSYTESGFTVLATSGSWQGGANYGNPRPFIRFQAQRGTSVTGEIEVTGGGATFSFTSIDLYSSTTPIPYRITGLRNSTPAFTLAGTVPNTFGAFRTVRNPDAAAVIDMLKIAHTNAAAPCCTNPMGLDNITLVK